MRKQENMKKGKWKSGRTTSKCFIFLLSYFLAFTFYISFLMGCGAGRFYNRGNELAEKGEWDRAVNQFAIAVTKAPDNLEYQLRLMRAKKESAQQHYKKGKEYLAKSELDSAMYELEMGYLLDNTNYQISLALEQVRNLKKAESHYKQGLEFEKDGKFELSLAEFQKALDLSTLNPSWKVISEIESAYLRVNKSLLMKQTATNELSLLSAKPITLKLEKAKLKEIFHIFGKMAGVNFIIDDGIANTTTSIIAEDLTFKETLDLLLRTNNLFCEQANQTTYLIFPRTVAKLQEHKQLYIYTFYPKNSDAKELMNLIRTMVGTKQIFVNPRLNALIVRDTPERISLIKKILEANDMDTPEVILEVELMEVDRTLLRKLGVELSQYSSTIGLATNPFNLKDIEELGKKESYLVNLPGAIVNMMRQQNATKILANPHIKVRNREKASIVIADRVPVQISTFTSATGQVSTQISYQYQEVGIKLLVTPEIQPDNDVVMTIRLEVSSIVGYVTTGQPQIRTRNTETVLESADGEVDVLGGLITDEERLTTSRLPILGELPLVGTIFATRDKNRVETDILMSITPHIVRPFKYPDIQLQKLPSGTEIYTEDTYFNRGESFLPDTFENDTTKTGYIIPDTIDSRKQEGKKARKEENKTDNLITQQPNNLIYLQPDIIKVSSEKSFKIELIGNGLGNIKQFGFNLHYNSTLFEFQQVLPGNLFGQIKEPPKISILKEGEIEILSPILSTSLTGTGTLFTFSFNIKQPLEEKTLQSEITITNFLCSTTSGEKREIIISPTTVISNNQ